MPSRPSKPPHPDHPPKRPRDINQLAYQIVQEATGGESSRSFAVAASVPPKPEKNPAAVALGKLGAAKGGKARARKLSPEQRTEIARDAAKARWKGKPKQ